MQYKTRDEYVERLALLRWYRRNAVNDLAVRGITAQLETIRSWNGSKWPEAERLAEVRYRELKAEQGK